MVGERVRGRRAIAQSVLVQNNQLDSGRGSDVDFRRRAQRERVPPKHARKVGVRRGRACEVQAASVFLEATVATRTAVQAPVWEVGSEQGIDVPRRLAAGTSAAARAETSSAARSAGAFRFSI